ncbi:CHAT domain-containing protein [Corallococcus carmarthensis]|uniref:CHAT domain-containing protein n=1 Tax=Corallococcus carmarthensis TaxID=2316728 RepID=A0A3A8K2U8_9BACT|nr:CHAT domain-containing protein [Corallococcus carmarthensis]RKH01617.1 CHAT domain-containing protein [Corallococcus carmarthensis]
MLLEEACVVDLMTADGWQGLFAQSAPVRGGVDIHIFPVKDLSGYSAAFGVVTCLAQDGAQSLFFSEIVILVPVVGSEEGALFEVNFVSRLHEVLEGVVASGRVEEYLGFVKTRIRVVAVLECETDALVAAVDSLSTNACVLVLKSDQFSSPSVLPPVELMATQVYEDEVLRINTLEDFWVPQVIHLHGRLSEVAAEKNLYVVIQVAQESPVRPENLDAIRNCNGGLVIGESSKGEQSSMAGFGRWVEMIKGGDEALAFCEIDGVGFNLLNTALAKAQCLLAADQGPLAFEFLLPFREELVSEAPAHIAHLAARLARQAGRREDAVALLNRAVHAEDSDLECLRSSLNLARLLGHDDLFSKTRELIIARYPQSDESVRATFVPLLNGGRYAEVADGLRPIVLRSHPSSLSQYLLLLAEAFAPEPIPDYGRFIQHVRNAMGDSQASQAVLDSLRDTLRRHLDAESVNLLVGQPVLPEFMEDAASLGLQILERILLAPSVLREQEVHNRDLETAAVVNWLVRYVATHPGDGDTRSALSRLVSPELAGTYGIALLLSLALDAIAMEPQGDGAQMRPVVESRSVDLEKAFNDLPVLIRQLPRTGVILGAVSLDFREVSSTPEDLLEAVDALLDRAVKESERESESKKTLAMVSMLLPVGIALARRINDSLAEYRLLRTGAMALALSGESQPARNLAEHGLVVAASCQDSETLRAAWHLFSDVYLRVRSIHDAALGLACVSKLESLPSGRRDVFFDAYLVVRLARDAGLISLAQRGMVSAEALLTEEQRTGINGLEIEVLRATIEMRAVFSDLGRGVDDEAASRIEKLAMDLERLLVRAREINAPLSPLLIVLAQVLAVGHDLHVAFAPSVQQVFEEGTRTLGPSIETRVRALMGADVGQLALSGMARTLASTRFAQDIGTDIAEGRVVAHRAISQNPLPSPEKVCFFLDWLGDHSVRIPRDDAGGKKELGSQDDAALIAWASRQGIALRPEQLVDLVKRLDRTGHVLGSTMQGGQVELPGDPAVTARRLALVGVQGIDVHLLGLSEQGRLVHACFSNGKVATVDESVEVFDVGAMEAWSKMYPSGFSLMDSRDPFGAQAVEHVMRRIGMSAEACERPLLLLPEAALQTLPGNLLLTEGRLVGTLRPVAMAPSLTWVHAAHSIPRQSTGRFVAWISEESVVEIGVVSALTQLREFTRQELEDFGFQIEGGAKPPESLMDADIAFVGAHGGIGQEGRYFRVVSDEAQTRLSARTLARQCSGAGVVVLAVCNSGRHDVDPYSGAAYGLARALLDHGCRAVIAPPWPLDVRVMRSWLPAFLTALEDGMPIIQANFIANREVGARLSWHPSVQVAMHVYGDPFLQMAVRRREARS